MEKPEDGQEVLLGTLYAGERTQGVELVYSWVFAFSGRNFSIYSERLLLWLIKIAQIQTNIEGLTNKQLISMGQVSITPLQHRIVEIPIRNLVSEGTNNYDAAKVAIKELMRSPYFYERPKMRGGEPVLDDKGRPVMEFEGHQILNGCEVNVKPGVAVIEVNATTWASLVDCSKGIRRIALDSALNLKLPQSLRFFEILYGRDEPLTLSIAQLRRMWNMDEMDSASGRYKTYPSNSNFISRFIAPAQQEIRKKGGDWYFDYKINYSYAAGSGLRRGRKSICSVTFFVYKLGVRLDGALADPKSMLASDYLDVDTYNMLVYKFGFKSKGLNNNVELFRACKRVGFDLFEFLQGAAPKILRAENPAGYAIECIRQELKDRYRVRFNDKKLPVVDDRGNPVLEA